MVKKKGTLKISKKRFLEWYFNDWKDMSASFIDNIYDALAKGKEFKISLEDVWEQLGYVPVEVIWSKHNKKIIDPADIEDACEDIEDPGEIEEPSYYYNVEWTK